MKATVTDRVAEIQADQKVKTAGLLLAPAT